MISRRRFVATGASGILLSGCDRLTHNEDFRGVLRSAEKLTMSAQRVVAPREALAREYSEADMSPFFRSNGTANPGTDEYARHFRRSARFRTKRKSPVTTVSRGGAQSANGTACGCRRFSTRRG